jgi:hypothetical protein
MSSPVFFSLGLVLLSKPAYCPSIYNMQVFDVYDPR